MNFQEKISPILQELHKVFWENDSEEKPNNWTDDDVMHATKIFLKIIYEKYYNLNHYEPLDKLQREATNIGEEIRYLVLRRCGIDSVDYYNYKKIFD